MSRSPDPYNPGRPPLVKTTAWITLVVAIAWALADIAGASVLAALTLIVGALTLMAGWWWVYRHWQTHEELPALLRKNLTGVLRSELPRGSLVTTGHSFGTFFKPGPPKKVKIVAAGLPPLEGEVAQRVISITSDLAGNAFVVDRKKSKPGKRIVLRQKPKEKSEDLTHRQIIERAITQGVRELFPKHEPKVALAWDEDKPDEDYLMEVSITGVNGMDLSLPGKRRQILQKLRTRLPKGNFKSDVDPTDDAIYFHRSRPLPEMVVPPAGQARPLRAWSDYERFTVPLAVGDEGAQAEWKPRRDAHLLIVGGTGGGKTITEHGVIQRLTQACWRTWLIDGKQVEFLGYQDWPNVEFLAQDVDSQIRLIYQAYTTMRERYKLIREKKVRIDELDPIALVIDEVTSLLEFVDERYEETKPKGGKSKAPVMKWLANILRLGRTAKIHLVFGMQRADTQILGGGEARDNFKARITLSKLESKEGSMMIWNDPAIGVAVPDHPGRAVSLINGVPTMVQAAYTANPDIEHPADYHPGMVRAMIPEHEVYSRKAVAEPIPPEGAESGEISWSHILDSKLLDADGNPVEFDPISSEESKLLRAQSPVPPRDGENHLQTADSFPAGLGLFAHDYLAQISYGNPLARHLARMAEEMHEYYGSEMAEERAPEPRVLSNTIGVDLDKSSTTQLRYIEPGQNILVDDIGSEEITVSTCEPDQDDPETYYLSGYTDDGESIHVELPADTAVEVFEREPEYATA